MLGKIEGRKIRGQQRTRWLGGITDSKDMNLSKLGESGGKRSLEVLQYMESQRVGTQLSNCCSQLEQHIGVEILDDRLGACIASIVTTNRFQMYWYNLHSQQQCINLQLIHSSYYLILHLFFLTLAILVGTF